MEAALSAVPDPCCRRCTDTGRWLRAAADRLGLRDYTITFEHDPPKDEGARATCELADAVRDARVRVAPWFWDLGAEERAYTLTHELCHVLVHELQETVRRGLGEVVGGVAFRIMMAEVDHEAEKLVDVFARAVAPSMPAPPG